MGNSASAAAVPAAAQLGSPRELQNALLRGLADPGTKARLGRLSADPRLLLARWDGPPLDPARDPDVMALTRLAHTADAGLAARYAAEVGTTAGCTPAAFWSSYAAAARIALLDAASAAGSGAGAAPAGDADDDDDDTDTLLFVHDECFVYKVPPRPGASGWVAAAWGLEKPVLERTHVRVTAHRGDVTIGVWQRPAAADGGGAPPPPQRISVTTAPAAQGHRLVAACVLPASVSRRRSRSCRRTPRTWPRTWSRCSTRAATLWPTLRGAGAAVAGAGAGAGGLSGWASVTASPLWRCAWRSWTTWLLRGGRRRRAQPRAQRPSPQSRRWRCCPHPTQLLPPPLPPVTAAEVTAAEATASRRLRRSAAASAAAVRRRPLRASRRSASRSTQPCSREGGGVEGGAAAGREWVVRLAARLGLACLGGSLLLLAAARPAPCRPRAAAAAAARHVAARCHCCRPRGRCWGLGAGAGAAQQRVLRRRRRRSRRPRARRRGGTLRGSSRQGCVAVK